MVTTRQAMQVQSTVLTHWWRQTRREHRLALRLIQENPENLARLNRLDTIIQSIDRIRTDTIRSRFPNSVREIRSYLLSTEHNFIECLLAIREGNMLDAEMHYNRAKNDLSLMQYIFMESGVESNI